MSNERNTVNPKIRESVECRVVMFIESGTEHEKAKKRVEAIWATFSPAERNEAAEAYFAAFRGLTDRQSAMDWLRRNAA